MQKRFIRILRPQGFFFQFDQQAVETDPNDAAILRAMGKCVKQVFAIGRHVLAKAVGQAIINFRAEA